ncbi:MAG: diacylglyceryl transferase [Bacteroidota bacterium]|nr:diacylglyceryl transferase [Bacteroidota bacterium]
MLRLKEKWGISSNWQIFVICFVFALTGSTSVKLAAPLLELLGIHDTLKPIIYWPLRILATFPVYQVLLIIFGTICGQFTFFWNIEKKMFARIMGKNTK